MSDDDEYSEDGNVGWIQWFCALQDHTFFCEVDEAFIRNEFNLHGLRTRVAKFNEALKMILRSTPPAEDEVDDAAFLEVYQSATQLYGLIHARYITTPDGLAFMRQRFLASRFGHCPRLMCEKQNVLPIAVSEDLKIARVKIYCPRCKDVYSPKKKSSDADGAFFGTSFPHLLLMTYPDIVPFFPKVQYVSKVYGFRIQPIPQSHAKLQQNVNKQTNVKNVLKNEITNNSLQEKFDQFEEKTQNENDNSNSISNLNSQKKKNKKKRR